MQLLTQWKGVSKYLLSDAATFFEHYDESHGVGYSLAYLALTFLVVSLPLFPISLALNGFDTAAAPGAAFLVVFVAAAFWVYTAVEAAACHVILLLIGGSDYSTTLEAYAFASPIRYALWWFPPLGFVPLFVGLYLQARGLGRFHDVSEAAAAGATIVAAVLPYVMFVAFVTLLVLALGLGAELVRHLPELPV